MNWKEQVTIRHNLTNKAFTLIELVIVISIMSILLAVSIPALNKARRSARSLIGVSRQRDTAFAVTLYAQDNDNQYPDSVARPKLGSSSPWREPTMLTAPGTGPNRSLSAYLYTYIKNANTIFCPSAPRKYEYLQEIWDAGDDWNDQLGNQFYGTYCFYWNYVGYLEEKNYPFRGPQSSSDGRQYSKLLTSDYLGFGHWRNVLTYGRHDAYGCCDEFNVARVTKGTPARTIPVPTTASQIIAPSQLKKGRTTGRNRDKNRSGSRSEKRMKRGFLTFCFHLLERPFSKRFSNSAVSGETSHCKISAA